jgi:hypothetical protein
VVPLGPFRKCLHPVVLHTSILTPTLTPAMWESPFRAGCIRI